MTGLLRSNTISFIASYFGVILVLFYQIVAHAVSPLVPRRLRYRRKDIRGQKILITGAGSGLGRQLAEEFSKHGTCLILVDINGKSLSQTVKQLDGRSTVFTYECDVSDYKKVCEMAEKVQKDAGDVDILVNNAAVFTGPGYLVDLPEDTINRTMRVNIMSHFWTAKAFLPAMIKKNSGHVVSIASIVGTIPVPKMVDYCTSKFACFGFAESLEIELRERKLDGIKVTIISPSHMDTGLFEGADTRIGTIMSPKYVAEEAVFAVLEERECLRLPYFCHLVPTLKEGAPRWLTIKLMEIVGTLRVMDNFTGRQTIDANKREIAEIAEKS